MKELGCERVRWDIRLNRSKVLKRIILFLHSFIEINFSFNILILLV